MGYREEYAFMNSEGKSLARALHAPTERKANAATAAVGPNHSATTITV